MEPERLLQIKRSRVRMPKIKGFKGELYPFQQTGVAYLYFARRGSLFDQCFKPDALILTDKGMVPAGDISVGDMIGQSMVERVGRRKASEFTTIRVEGFPPVELTSDHKVLVCRKTTTPPLLCKGVSRFEESCFIPAGEVKAGDRLHVDLDFSGYAVPEFFMSSAAVAIAARYVADGFMRHRVDGCPTAVGLVFGNKTKQDMPRFQDYAVELDIPVYTQEIPPLRCSRGRAKDYCPVKFIPVLEELKES